VYSGCAFRGTIFVLRRFSAVFRETEAEMSLRTFTICAVVTSALTLAACGTDPGDRAVSGGLLGAGAGAAIGSVTGSAGKGALIGGLAGAAIGAFTDPCALNLGDPYWRRHGGEEEYYRRCDHR
jgi:osmotically inducible lipoprotein OsmB